MAILLFQDSVQWGSVSVVLCVCIGLDCGLCSFNSLTLCQQPAEPLATRIRQLQRREDDLAATHTSVLKSLFGPVKQFERQYENTIWDFDFRPGALVLVRNTSF